MTSGLLNKDVFFKDPSGTNLPNAGVAQVRSIGDIVDPDDAGVLRPELETFVCQGQYKAGLETILSTFLGHLGNPVQPAVWVSGFFGSGKSHFSRVLEALWRNATFADGARARDLTSLPEEIRVLLRELSTAGDRAGGLWSASGMVTENRERSFMLNLLGIVFSAAGLSSDYGRARFQMYLRRNGWEQPVKDALTNQGKNFDQELGDYLASTVLANAVLTITQDLGATPMDVLDRFEHSFPTVLDVSEEQFVADIRTVLSSVSTHPGRLPLTLIVLDEMQQYIDNDSDRAQKVQRTVELLQSQFESHILVAGTGQAKLNDTPHLQKLQGRFLTRVMLSDQDVENVVRHVVLLKAPDKEADVRRVIDGSIGEINRHLKDSDISPRPEDRDVLIEDYPLLPTRRRFWERVLRRADPSGTAGQLRNQLLVVHQANKAIANQPLGTVIAGDMIFNQLREVMVQSGFLIQDVNRFISEQEDGTEDGNMRARLCAMIFLIQELTDSDNPSTQLRATADNLADLLVDNLTIPSHELRNRIPALLSDLVENGKLTQAPNGEYRIQTGESLQWHEEFNRQVRGVSDARVAELRTSTMRNQIAAQLKTLVKTQGKSKEPRDFSLHFGTEAPEADATKVPIWIRDQTNTSKSTVTEDARNFGIESPIILVYIPTRSLQVDLNNAIRRALGAEATLNWGGNPSTPAGIQAHENMRHLRDRETRQCDAIITDLLGNAEVYQSGGNEIQAGALKEAIQEAFVRSLDRLYTRFHEADDAGWNKVFSKATEGSGDALVAVGFSGDPIKHPVCRAISTYTGGEPGKTWQNVRSHFKIAPFGWGQDAIDGALFALLGSHAIRATKNGRIAPLNELRNRQQLAQVTFIGESEPLSKPELILLRGLFTHLGYPTSKDEDIHSNAPKVVIGLRSLARQAGGDPPLPLAMPPAYLIELENLGGNQLLQKMVSLADQIRTDHANWATATTKIEQRRVAWNHLERFARHAAGLPGAGTLQAQIDAIRDGRQLLNDPDPVPPIRQQLTAALRARLNQLRETFTEQHLAQENQLQAADEWLRLKPDEQVKISTISKIGLHPFADIRSDDQLLANLEQHRLDDLENQIQALPARFADARQRAIKAVQPDAVHVSLEKGVLRTEAEVNAWIAKTKQALLHHIRDGKSVSLV